MDILDQWEKEAIVKPPVFKQYEHTYDFDTKDRQKIRALIAVVRKIIPALELYKKFDVRIETEVGLVLGEKTKTDTGFFNPAEEAIGEAERILNAS